MKYIINRFPNIKYNLNLKYNADDMKLKHQQNIQYNYNRLTNNSSSK